MRITAEPRSDQINYEDFIGGPKIFTIGGVSVGTAEQKYDIQLVEEQRVWRPPLTVLRILIACWGDDATVWQGRKVELYGDPSIRFGKEAVGGIRIKALSHIDQPKTVTVTVARGKRQKITVQPLVATESITMGQWQQLVQVAAAKDISAEAVAALATEIVGKELAGPDDIPAGAFDAIHTALTTGETP